MKSARHPSLKRRFIIFPFVINIIAIIIFCFASALIWLNIFSGGMYCDDLITQTIASSIERDSHGKLILSDTSKISSIDKNTTNLWFIVSDYNGNSLSYGSVPIEYRSMSRIIYRMSFGDWRDTIYPYYLAATLRTQNSRAGMVAVLAHGELTSVVSLMFATSNIMLIPLFITLLLVSLTLVPTIVRISLSGLKNIADLAERINIERTNTRLPEKAVPIEILPLIRAINDALQRIDDGYQRHRRFITDAAHELRTPIAILQAKIEISDGKYDPLIRNDIARLSNLSEQLLDFQRFDQKRSMVNVDLAILSRKVVADMAPLLFSNKRDIELIVEDNKNIQGDSGSLERVLINIIQNAVEHGGRHIIVRIRQDMIEVEDDGPGIPIEERERVFDPFYRLKPRSFGAGLGLNLAKQIMEQHNGRISALDAPKTGTIIRLEFATKAGGFEKLLESGAAGVIPSLL